MTTKEERKSKRKAKREEKDRKMAKDSMLRGVLWVILAALFFIVLPIVMIYVVAPRTTDSVEWKNLIPLFQRWLYAGIVLTVLIFPYKYYGMGGKKQMLFAIIYLVASIASIVFVINFGDLADLVTVTVNGSVYSFGLVINLMLGLMIFMRLIKILEIYADYKDHKKSHVS